MYFLLKVDSNKVLLKLFQVEVSTGPQSLLRNFEVQTLWKQSAPF